MFEPNVFEVILVRHGEVAGNSGPNPKLAGWADKPLTARGVLQAQCVTARLKDKNIGAIWSSDLQRARITAEAIAAPHGLKVHATAELRESNYGLWENLGYEEIERDWAELWAQRLKNPTDVAPPEGENFAQLWARLEPAWNRFLDAAEKCSEEGTVEFDRTPSGVLVAHNGPLRFLLCHILGIPVENYRRVQTSNCGISRVRVAVDVERKTRSFVVSCINDTAHLRDI